MRGVSIIICCYNSAGRIQDTLKAVSRLDNECSIPVEVIIVDNASTDNTPDIAVAEWSRFTSNFDFQVVSESKPGLTNARIKGAQSAKYSYIIFCDDDNHLYDNYLNVSVRLLDLHSDIGAIGGMGIGISDVQLPKWFHDFEDAYAVGRQEIQNGYLSERLFLWGAGLVLRKEILDVVFSPKYPLLLSDRKGKELSSGGDSEICLRIQLLGYKLYYTDELKYNHYISSDRLTKDYRLGLFDGFDLSGEVLGIYCQFVLTGRESILKRILYSIKILTISISKYFLFTKDSAYLNRKLESVAIALRISCLSKSKNISAIIKFIRQK